MIIPILRVFSLHFQCCTSRMLKSWTFLYFTRTWKTSGEAFYLRASYQAPSVAMRLNQRLEFAVDIRVEGIFGVWCGDIFDVHLKRGRDGQEGLGFWLWEVDHCFQKILNGQPLA